MLPYLNIEANNDKKGIHFMNLIHKTPPKNLIKRSLFIAVLTALTACGDDDVPVRMETGIFIDSPVMNINYATTSDIGKTNAAGEFSYVLGDKITFSIGGVTFPEVLASEIVTPLDLAIAASDDAQVQTNIAVNIARLLQSLDIDGNPQNGIEIPQDLSMSSGIDFALSSTDFESAFNDLAPSHNLISATVALEHLEEELSNRGIDITMLSNFVIVDPSDSNTDNTGGDTGGGDTGGGDTGGGDTGGGDTGGGDTGGGDTGGGDTGGGDTGGGDTGGGDTGGDIDSPLTLSSLPAVITNLSSFTSEVTLTGGLNKLITLDVAIEKNYASLSLYTNDTLLIDSIDIPAAGSHVLHVLAKFPATGQQVLKLVGRSSDITVNALTIVDTSQQMASFQDISQDIGLDTEDTLKYGGPAIGDVNNDGYYDFVLANHNYVPPQLVSNNGNNTVTIERLFSASQDFHGNALGDYDNDGDLDIMVALGGANGTSPSSYALLKNNDGVFENVSIAAGINTPARGRAPRWADFDLDGDLDILLVNATTANNDGPIQLFYRNMGDGTFTPVRVPGVESKASERVLVTDFNGDNIDDLVLYSPLSLWAGNGDFSFTNVSASLPEGVNNVWGINAITDVDVNNDGKVDLYLAFGKTQYQLSRKSIDFNPNNGELNIRDDGETGTTLINFTAPADINLSELNLTYRQYNGDFPIFLGTNKTRKVVKASGFQPNQLPAEMANAEDSLSISQEDAAGWPTNRDVNGLYIGHTDDGNWKAEWVRDQNVYWDVTFTLDGLSDVNYDWTPNNRNGQDILLINQGDSFVNASDDWDLPKGGDHWGVTHGDFNNDGWNDLYVYRYGFLKERISDLLLLNTGNSRFVTTHTHGAVDHEDNGHGDMGQAFDFDKDGLVDILSGSEEEGHWYLWQNQTVNSNNYLLVDVGYSPLNNVDSLAAKVVVTTESGDVYEKRIGSAGEVFSAGVIDTVHFGLGQQSNVSKVDVTWRNGEMVTLSNITANDTITTDNAANPIPSVINLGLSDLRLRETESALLEPTFIPLNATPGIEWSSSNSSIATVDTQGNVTAVSVGEVTIVATSTADSSVTTQLTVVVGEFESIEVTDVTIVGTDQAFYEGQQVQLTAEITPIDADNTDIIWSSSNENVASINADGIVSAISVGTSSITATASGSADDSVVSDTAEITVEQFFNQTIVFDDTSKYTADLPIDTTLEVTANYNAGSGQVVSDAGIRFYIRELTSAWAPVNDLILNETTSVGTSAGSVSVYFDLSELKLTSELDEGNFYFLFVQYSNDKGESVDKGLSPLNIVEGGTGATDPLCDSASNTNLLECANTNGEKADVSEWYAYAKNAYTTDLSSEISVSNEQANGGNGSIKFAFNDAGTEQHFILKDVDFAVTTEGQFKFDVDVFGDNLSAGTDFVIEISLRPSDMPEAAETYKLWHRRSAATWHNLTMTSTLPVGNYIVGFKVFSPGFANTLTLDIYLDNIVVTQL